MILTWIFRAVFVPLLIAAIVTSNCDAAEAACSACADLARLAGLRHAHRVSLNINDLAASGPCAVYN